MTRWSECDGGEVRSATGAHGATSAVSPAGVVAGPRLLIAGVGDRWRGDASFGPLVCGLLAQRSWPPGVRFADLGDGPLSMAQALAAAAPPYDRLLLVASVARGRPLATLRRYRWRPGEAYPAVGWRRSARRQGHHHLDRLLDGALGLGVLPPEVVVFELEPVTLAGEGLSPEAATLLPGLLEVLRREALVGGAHLAA